MIVRGTALAGLLALTLGPAMAAQPDRCSAVTQVGPWSVRVVESDAGGSILLSRE